MNLVRTQPSLSRDFALLSLFILFILALVLVWVAHETVGNYEADAQKQMEAEALRIDRALIVEIENASYILESLGRQIQATTDKSENVAQLYFSFAKSEGPKRSIFSWVNKAQMITVSNNLGVLDTPIDVSDRDYVKKSIAEPWKVHIGRPIEGRLSKKWVLPLALGLTDKNGTYMGSAIVALDTELLTENIGRTVQDSKTHFAITNLALTPVVQSADSGNFFADHFDVTTLAKIDFDKTKSGTYSQVSMFDEKSMYAYFERSSQYPYIIFLGLDPDQSRAAIRKLLQPRLFQLIVIASFLLYVLWKVRTSIIHPVMKLAEETSAIVRGEPFTGDDESGPLEITQLASEIKRLDEYIKERRRIEDELRLKNAELTRVKEAAHLTNQVKADFFAYVGHELTEPVEIIEAQAETIKDQQFGPIGNTKYLGPADDIYHQAQQLLQMLGDIKAISKAETGLLSLNESEVELGFVLQKTVRIFRDRNPGSIEIQTDIGQEPVRLNGDELRIKQMILGILTAAAHQLSPGETIRISSSLKAQELALIFSYSAAGTFASASRSKHGLELALARLLIAMHEGSLEVKTTADKITAITLRFPSSRLI